MTLKPWKVLDSRYVHKNVRVDRCEITNGMVLEPVILEYSAWVNTLALTVRREVLMVRQYRHGVQKEIWELPGGMVEAGESPLEGAQRELLEETGFAGGNFIETGRSYPNPASHNNIHYSFLALDVEKAGDQKLDDTEELEVSLVPMEQVIKMVEQGEFMQALHLTTLFFGRLHMGNL